MEKVKKLLAALALFAIIIGIVGGIGYTVMLGEYVIAVCIAVVAMAVVPTVVKLDNFLKS